MRRAIAAAAVLIVAALNTPGYAKATAAGATTVSRVHIVKKSSARQTVRAQRSSNHQVTYDRNAKDPNVGWHTEGGMRVCTQDCDNPEIPESGYSCRDVNILGMAMRECDSSSCDDQNRGISGNATPPA
jgi:hypothetical protein